MKSRENHGKSRIGLALIAALAGASMLPCAVSAQVPATAAPALTYADLVDLSDAASLVVKAQIRKQSTLPPERSPMLRPGWVRLYVEADTLALISGPAAIGESLKYLVDVPLDARGKVPKLKKQVVILFALPVPGKPSQLQLVDVDSQIPADPETEQRLRLVLGQLADPFSPPRITGVREALSVEGNLAGESETQVFLDTENGEPVSLNVVRRPNMAPQWGVSWTDLVDQSAAAPQRDTLDWYRLACFLPDELPYDAILSRDGASRARAANDYEFVLAQLGPCLHHRTPLTEGR